MFEVCLEIIWWGIFSNISFSNVLSLIQGCFEYPYRQQKSFWSLLTFLLNIQIISKYMVPTQKIFSNSRTFQDIPGHFLLIFQDNHHKN